MIRPGPHPESVPMSILCKVNPLTASWTGEQDTRTWRRAATVLAVFRARWPCQTYNQTLPTSRTQGKAGARSTSLANGRAQRSFICM